MERIEILSDFYPEAAAIRAHIQAQISGNVDEFDIQRAVWQPRRVADGTLFLSALIPTVIPIDSLAPFIGYLRNWSVLTLGYEPIDLPTAYLFGPAEIAPRFKAPTQAVLGYALSLADAQKESNDRLTFTQQANAALQYGANLAFNNFVLYDARLLRGIAAQSPSDVASGERVFIGGHLGVRDQAIIGGPLFGNDAIMLVHTLKQQAVLQIPELRTSVVGHAYFELQVEADGSVSNVRILKSLFSAKNDAKVTLEWAHERIVNFFRNANFPAANGQSLITFPIIL